MNEEFYSRQQAMSHGDKLFNEGNRFFGLSSYTTAEGIRVYFFDWLSEFTNEVIQEWHAWFTHSIVIMRLNEMNKDKNQSPLQIIEDEHGFRWLVRVINNEMQAKVDDQPVRLKVVCKVDD